MPLNWLQKLLNESNVSAGSGAKNRGTQAAAEEPDLGEFRAQIAREIAAGYASPREVLESSIDLISDEIHPEILKSKGPQILEEELAQHLLRQKGWPEITDCDRLDSAFAVLEENGIVSRQNFSCCGTCGTGEIYDEIETLKNAGNNVRGYTFFHMQDTQSAVEGFGLYLNYGSTANGDEAAVSIGREIQHELHKFGLATDWDGKLSKRIGVPLNWQKRTKQQNTD